MSDAVVQVNNLGKRYRIGVADSQATNLREAVGNLVGASFGYLRRMSRPPTEAETLWALRGVSFEVPQGEVLGIVGHNGAGKSTLLKILSRITEPTEGRAVIDGRIGSLLEVGTGFHGELTGRENTYLNGAILGMKRREIDRKFDEIVAFAEIEKFIDTPVKRFSSGMYVRLAFAVAAHLDANVLLMDEVLAVGDANFQLKCFDKIQQLVGQGRTIFLVSHNMSAVTRLCERAILMEKGQMVSDGPAAEVVSSYLSKYNKTAAFHEWLDPQQAPGDDVVWMKQVRVRNTEGETVEVVDIRQPIGIELDFEVLQPGHILVPNLHFHNEERIHVFAVQDTSPEWRHKERPVGHYTTVVWLPGNFLAEGQLLVTPAISSHIPTLAVHGRANYAIAFNVTDSMEGDSARGDYYGPFPGLIRPVLNWETHFLTN